MARFKSPPAFSTPVRILARSPGDRTSSLTSSTRATDIIFSTGVGNTPSAPASRRARSASFLMTANWPGVREQSSGRLMGSLPLRANEIEIVHQFLFFVGREIIDRIGRGLSMLLSFRALAGGNDVPRALHQRFVGDAE